MAINPLIARPQNHVGNALGWIADQNLAQQRNALVADRTAQDAEQFNMLRQDRQNALAAQTSEQEEARLAALLAPGLAQGDPEAYAAFLEANDDPRIAAMYGNRPPEEAGPLLAQVMANQYGLQLPPKAPGPIEFKRTPWGGQYAEQDGQRVPGLEYNPPQPQQYGPATYSNVTVMENGKPVVYAVNSRSPSDRVRVGDAVSAGGDAGQNAGLNDRQISGVNMQRDAALNYAANLTKLGRDEIDRIYLEGGPDAVAKVVNEKGKRLLQGWPARAAESLPGGKMLVEATNADLIGPRKAGGAGLAMMQNPTGPITTPDFQAGEAQFPGAVYPLPVQAEMLRQMLRGGGEGQPANGASSDPLAEHVGKVIVQNGKRYQVIKGANGKTFAQELK